MSRGRIQASDADGTSNVFHSIWRAPVASAFEEGFPMTNTSGPVIVNYVLLEGGQTSCTVGSVEAEPVVPNQPPIIVTHRVHGHWLVILRF